MAIARSGYVAAVATNSGGITERMTMPVPHAPAAITMSGPDESLVIDTAVTSKTLNKEVSAFGALAVECNHGGGHCGAPAELYLAAWQLMKDHPFGIAESPYAQGLPPSFPANCAVQR
jgi:hypothetical protein